MRVSMGSQVNRRPISPAVLNAFHRAGLRYAIIPGGLTIFIQAIDVAPVALYREEHDALYMQMVEGGRKVSASACRNEYIDLSYRAYMTALKRLNVPQTFQDLGYIDPTKVKLRIPFQFAPPAAPQPAPKPKPKAVPKPFPKQMSIASFFGRR